MTNKRKLEKVICKCKACLTISVQGRELSKRIKHQHDKAERCFYDKNGKIIGKTYFRTKRTNKSKKDFLYNEQDIITLQYQDFYEDLDFNENRDFYKDQDFYED
ncbi:hypothetical protein F8M41_025975 [Gigaspora margarita]|uniref:Uncharacterized protein n=1 Tax=Gigaspora margarita TaxID=4874 RepID=A0A8H3XIC4_GIGMA|nr:hypothetical protein F8M41_025975 [Gigaspora margarita]